MPNQPESDISSLAKQKNRGLLNEIVSFALSNKKYWLIPFILTLLILGSLVIFSGSSAAPFIYTLF